jgi:hypothetical protein
MSDMSEQPRIATRRDFLRDAGVAAGSIGMLAPQEPRTPQAPTKSTPSPEDGGAMGTEGGHPRHFRASPPAKERLRRLGPLAELPGTWVGGGYDLISLPDFQDHKMFRVLINSTVETLEFISIGGKVPNRGFKQDDIFLHGVTYVQRVSDAVTKGALHIEPGIWLHVPPTTTPPNAKATVVRQASIPHGTSVLAEGDVIPTVVGGPKIQSADSTPTRNPPGPPLGAGYLAPFNNPNLPPGFKPPFIKNPNLALQETIDKQASLGDKIIYTEVLAVSATPDGGIVNIPFLRENANVTKFNAVFWIETVQQPDGTEFMQLQYTQTTILTFDQIDWPHISVATLVKQ